MDEQSKIGSDAGGEMLEGVRMEEAGRLIEAAIDGNLYIAEGLPVAEGAEPVVWIAIAVGGVPIGLRHELTREEARQIANDLLTFANGGK